MRILKKEERSGPFGRDCIYQADCLSDTQEVQKLLEWLVKEGYALQTYTIHFVYDHADFRPPLKFEHQEDLLDVLRETDFWWVENINITMAMGIDAVYATIYPTSNVVRLSFPKKN